MAVAEMFKTVYRPEILFEWKLINSERNTSLISLSSIAYCNLNQMTLYILLTIPAQFSGSPALGYHLQGARVDAGRILQRKEFHNFNDTRSVTE